MPIPKPTEVSLNLVEAKSLDDIKTLLTTHGVAVIALNDITTLQRNNAVNATKFYQNANVIFKEHKIKEPPLPEKLLFTKFKQQKALLTGCWAALKKFGLIFKDWKKQFGIVKVNKCFYPCYVVS